MTPSGLPAFIALEKAVADIHAGECLGLATGPVSKKNWLDAGIPYSGHTEVLEMLANRYYPPPIHESAWQADMFFQYQNFRLLLLTRHIPLASITELETAKQSVKALIETLSKNSVSLRGSEADVAICHAETNGEGLHGVPLSVGFPPQGEGTKPLRLALLGVNPHAGEIGGNEERDVLIPLKQWVESTYPHVTMTNPLPADAFFRGFDAQTGKGYDAVIAPTHDQGLIPMKLLGGFEAVNVTIGLPFIRTSVSHGMGEDIVGQGIADPTSLLRAIEYVKQFYQATSTELP
jgi:4-hydroxythreonine-4-phosphate dehydrogenase